MTSNQTGSMIKDKAEGITDQIKGLVETGHDKLNAAKDKIVDAKDVVVDKAESMVSMVGKTIKEHPFTSVGIAFGIGYALRLIRR